MRLFKFLAVITFVMLAAQVSAQQGGTPRRKSQVIDDSTKQIYGPNTTKWYWEQDVFYNRNVIHSVDTFSRNFHRWTYVTRYNYLYQDLGNIGTSIRPIYYQSPETIGVRSGFDVYDLYWDSQAIQYYDTKSPYTNMHVVIGGKGRSTTKVAFSRNVNPRWNLGFNFNTLLIDKQVPPRSGKGDRAVRSTYYDAYTAYNTKDSVYRFFLNFQRMNHGMAETGGVVLPEDSAYAAYFAPNVVVGLNTAQSTDFRVNIHFSQTLRLGSALQFYHTFDRYRQKVLFIDDYNSDRRYFNYVSTLGDTVVNSKTEDEAKFKVVRNEVGFKGNLLKLFYNGYVGVRHYNMYYDHYWTQDSVKMPAQGDEGIIGGRMELSLDSLGLINGWVEANQDGNFRIEGNIVSRWFDGSIKQKLYKPSFQQQAYLGKHNKWNNTFAPVQSTEVNGHLHYRSRVLNVSPGLTFTRLGNYVYYKHFSDSDSLQRTTSVQSQGDQIFFTPELKVSVTLFRRFTISNQTIYTVMVENADDAIRLPDIFTNTQVAYHGIHFNRNLDVHVGADIHWQSTYFPPLYDPAIRQFYNDDKKFEVFAYPVVDLFLNAKIKRGRIFIRYHNFLQVFTGTGYLATPGYPAQKNILDFGFDLSLYD